MTMHRVVADSTALHSYLERGYQLSSASLAEHMGKAWELLCKEDRDDLVLLEIDEARHQQLNQPERVYCVHQRAEFVVVGAELLKLDVLERGERNSLCASAQVDDGPRWFVDAELGSDPRQAIALARPSLLQAIAEHRRVADELESFLMGMEAL